MSPGSSSFRSICVVHHSPTPLGITFPLEICLIDCGFLRMPIFLASDRNKEELIFPTPVQPLLELEPAETIRSLTVAGSLNAPVSPCDFAPCARLLPHFPINFSERRSASFLLLLPSPLKFFDVSNRKSFYIREVKVGRRWESAKVGSKVATGTYAHICSS